MNVEIERKFLVKSEAWRGLAEGVRFRQGYLQTHPCTVRVRTEGERGVLTIKGQTRGFSREEFEYEIRAGTPTGCSTRWRCHPSSTRSAIKSPIRALSGEVDEFLGDNAGLVVAEIRTFRRGASLWAARLDWGRGDGRPPVCQFRAGEPPVLHVVGGFPGTMRKL